MSKPEEKQVLFFRKGKNLYYKYQDHISEVNYWSINSLKENLTLPYKVEFIGCSRAQTGKIVSDLYDAGEEVKFEKVNARANHAIHFIVEVSEKRIQ